MLLFPSLLLPYSVSSSLSGSVMLNGQPEALPVLTADLVVRRSSSSFLMIHMFGAQLLWHTEGPLILITLQPGFAHKVQHGVISDFHLKKQNKKNPSAIFFVSLTWHCIAALTMLHLTHQSVTLNIRTMVISCTVYSWINIQDCFQLCCYG